MANNARRPAWFRRAAFCRHSGLPVICPEMFVSPHPDSTYHAEFARLGEKILLIKASGYVRCHEMDDALKFSNGYITTHFEEKTGLVMIEDYADVQGADAGARKKYIDYFTDSGIFMGGILYNLPLLFKFSFNMARRLHLYDKPAYTADSYAQAVDIALNLLRGSIPEFPNAEPGKTPPAGSIRNGLRLRALNVMGRLRMLPSKLYSEVVLDYIYSIDWQKDDRKFFNSRMPANRHLKSVLDGISFIKSEIDALLREKGKAEADLLDYQRRLKKLSVQLSMTEEKQRRELASQLHEQIGQDLFVAYMQISRMEKSKDLGQLPGVKDRILKIIKETKTITFDLSPPVLYDFGIREALESLARSVQSKHGLQVRTRFDGEVDHLSDEIKILLYRSISELIHNSVKHAESSEVRIWIENGRDRLHAEVSDNGAGFNPQTAGEGFGLFDIREKMNHLGGSMDIDSTPGEGTSVRLTVPLPAGELSGQKKAAETRERGNLP